MNVFSLCIGTTATVVCITCIDKSYAVDGKNMTLRYSIISDKDVFFTEIFYKKDINIVKFSKSAVTPAPGVDERFVFPANATKDGNNIKFEFALKQLNFTRDNGLNFTFKANLDGQAGTVDTKFTLYVNSKYLMLFIFYILSKISCDE